MISLIFIPLIWMSKNNEVRLEEAGSGYSKNNLISHRGQDFKRFFEKQS